MNKYSVDATAKTLTLAFEKAATRETQLSHPWRYFVAGGETLQKIQDIIADYASVQQGYADLAAKAGAKTYDGDSFYFDFKPEEMKPLTGNERVDNNLQGGKGSEPWQCKRIERIPGFVVTDSRAYGQFIPDVATPEGAALRDECRALKERAQPAVRFARWLGCEGVQVPENPDYPHGSKKHVSATATKVGEQWIVAVPVVTMPEGGYPPKSFKEEWTLPPDSKALSVSEYFGLLEQNRLLQSTPPQTPRPN